MPLVHFLKTFLDYKSATLDLPVQHIYVGDLLFLPTSVRREVKELSELLLLQHFLTFSFFWKIFKVNKALLSLDLSVFELHLAVCS